MCHLTVMFVIITLWMKIFSSLNHFDDHYRIYIPGIFKLLRMIHPMFWNFWSNLCSTAFPFLPYRLAKFFFSHLNHLAVIKNILAILERFQTPRLNIRGSIDRSGKRHASENHKNKNLKRGRGEGGNFVQKENQLWCKF